MLVSFIYCIIDLHYRLLFQKLQLILTKCAIYVKIPIFHIKAVYWQIFPPLTPREKHEKFNFLLKFKFFMNFIDLTPIVHGWIFTMKPSEDRFLYIKKTRKWTLKVGFSDSFIANIHAKLVSNDLSVNKFFHIGIEPKSSSDQWSSRKFRKIN